VDPSGVARPPSVPAAADDAAGGTLPDGDVGGDAGPTGEERSSRRRRVRWLAAGALALAVVAMLAIVLLGSGSSGHHGSVTGVPAGDTTASVTRRTLSESSTVDGTLGYGATLELYDRLAGTFTWLPSVGAVIVRGGTLWRIDDLPIVLMYGSVPAYRRLKDGVSRGPDVAELNRNLVDLGFDPYGAITDDESFGEATAAAVRRWQKAEGLTETGEVALGRVVFAPGARRVTAVKVTLGQDPPPASGATGTTPTTPTPTTPAATPPAANKPAANKTPKKKPAKAKPVKKAPAKEKPAKEAPAKEEPAKKTPSKGSPSRESAAGAGEVALSSTSTQQIVQLKVKPEQQQLARLRETVTVQLPGGGEVRGRVTEVGTVASEPKGSEEKGSPAAEGGESTIPVTVTLDHPVAHLDEAPVSVELVKRVRRNVLTVPATALIATAGGGYAVEVLQGGRRVTVTVSSGVFAGGYVEVTGAGVHEGMTVIESQ
jgi:peptidoglycan hydrolase-like protein with peptidoglycan-binding domain